MRGQKKRGRNLLWVLTVTMVSSSGGLGDVGHCKRNRNLKENYKWALLNYTKLRAESSLSHLIHAERWSHKVRIQRKKFLQRLLILRESKKVVVFLPQLTGFPMDRTAMVFNQLLLILLHPTSWCDPQSQSLNIVGNKNGLIWESCRVSYPTAKNSILSESAYYKTHEKYQQYWIQEKKSPAADLVFN